MAFMPRNRLGPPPRSFAADAHDCIMVRVSTDPTEYKVVARASATSPIQGNFGPEQGNHPAASVAQFVTAAYTGDRVVNNNN